MVRCQNCLETSRSTEHNSCPEGTKLFSPRSRNDWRTFLASAGPLRDPNWIIDVTRPANGCGGCAKSPMNSMDDVQGNADDGWRTKDGSPWWLRSTNYEAPGGDYHSNCYLDLWEGRATENSVTFKHSNCRYHSKSYYCQPLTLEEKPAAGSPAQCK